MRRVISIFLPTWPTDRLRRQPGAAVPPPDKPLVTAIHDGRRQSVAAVDAASRAEGLGPGMPLAQAQAMVQGLAVVPADPEGDRQALDALAAWCLRYAPPTSADAPDGIWIDATGAAHLFGGEAALLADIVARLAGGDIVARAAIADTPGAAWATARYADAPTTVVPAGEAAAWLAPLPIAALRLPADTVDGLSRLGFDLIEQLMTAHRAPIALRFGGAAHRRLDQALGHVFEPIKPVMPPETVRCHVAFPEPLLTPESLASVIGRLADGVCAELERRGQGARRLDLTFARVDRTRQTICIGTARPSRRAAHLARLLDEQLERVDPGLGVEAMSLAVPLAEPLTFAQPKAGLIDSGGADAGRLRGGRPAGQPPRRQAGLPGYAGGERRAGAERAQDWSARAKIQNRLAARSAPSGPAAEAAAARRSNVDAA